MAAKKKVSKKKAVAKKESTEMSTSFMEDDAGAGFENADGDSYAIPFLKLLQSTSKACKKSSGEYIKGAEEGFIMDTVTKDFFEDGLRIIPCAFTRSFIEWIPVDDGGGFVAKHTPENLPGYTTNEDGKWITKDGHELVDTREHFILYETADGTWVPALLAMTSTNLKVSRQMMSMLRQTKLPSGKRAPMYGCVIKLSTIPQSDGDFDWFIYKVEGDGFVPDEDLFAAAKDFHEQCKVGVVQTAEPMREDDSSTDVM